MDTTSTIVAVASPPGHAARGIVRASGGEACAHVAAAIDPACAARHGVVARRRGVHAHGP
jgi:tRNA U34 5-carboxymethylaminomethyl modifying GTPase MnmE/TrmE